MTKANDASTKFPVLKQTGTGRREMDDVLAVEEPLEIRLGYTDEIKGRIHKSISITMRTPGHDDELAAGFLFSEGIITTMQQIESVDSSRANVVRVELKTNISFDFSRLERHFYTTSSCGVCGKASLEALSMQGAQALIDNDFSMSCEDLRQLGSGLRKQQPLFRETGGNHGAAVFSGKGEILLVREDVGRHNAMDKLIGRLLMEEQLPMENTGILVSGRASFELMQKALMASCPMLVAVGAPSSLAVELAQEYNITLIGFLKQDSFNIYQGAERVGQH